MQIQAVYIDSYQADLEREVQIKIPISGAEQPKQEKVNNSQSIETL